ncbi:MAG: hypothetical protein GWN00_06500, partial [Aliifodinibius sp.]|nr:hypothetical protein [Fodinibius sp.]NIV10872.1 hypothetical protein [Fodinibius sp.]NIY24466.1 hypothetical protein [Fodinibius sp.]
LETVENGIYEGTTALMLASANGYPEIVQLLLANGADVNMRNKENASALFLAVQNDDVTTVEFLINAGAEVNFVLERDVKDVPKGVTPLMLVATHGHIQVARSLLAHGANLEARDRFGATALMYAIMYGQPEMANFLIQNGADVHTQLTEDHISFQYFKGDTPLIAAALHEDFKTVRNLISRGADVNASNQYGMTALMQASYNGNLELVNLLLSQDANINMQISQERFGYFTPGDCPILLAASAGHTQVAKTLLNAGADVNSANQYGYTPIINAAFTGNLSLVKLLIERGADVNGAITHDHILSVNEGDTPLRFAVERGVIEVVRELIQAGAKVNAANQYGVTPLISACETGGIDIARLLLAEGADPNHRGYGGETALFSAVRRQDAEMVQLLISSGANVNVVNNDRLSPSDIAKPFQNNRIYTLLSKAGVMDCSSPLNEAIKRFNRKEYNEVQVYLDQARDCLRQSGQSESINAAQILALEGEMSLAKGYADAALQRFLQALDIRIKV